MTDKPTNRSNTPERHENKDSSRFVTHPFTQTSPLALSGYAGADHQGSIKLSFDESSVPDDEHTDHSVIEDLNWCLEAINSVVHYPTLYLWIRTEITDLLIGYHPVEAHEKSGHLRAAVFERDDPSMSQLTRETERESGLITQFDATNTVYDFIVPTVDSTGYSIVLADRKLIQSASDEFTHPIGDLHEDIVTWGRHQLFRKTYNIPHGDERVAYASGEDTDHLGIVTKHINSFN